MKLSDVFEAQEQSELEHHGVKGMKWGVRRYKQLRNQANASEQRYGKATKNVGAQSKAVESSEKGYSYLKSAKKGATWLRNKKDNKFTRSVEKGAKSLEKKGASVVREKKAKLKAYQKEVRSSKRDYESAVSKAAKLPIEIRKRKVASYVKPVARELMWAYAGQKFNFNTKATGGKTQKDRFDENVSRAKRKTGKPVKIRTDAY